MIRPESGRDVRPAIARALAEGAETSRRAFLVGNRAGVVEWANPAWTRMTGFPLDETLSKPITHFLREAAIEVDLVDFVAQQFLEGRRSSIEFPFETFDGRSIWVHLEVRPIRDAEGEITEFLAVASDASRRREQDLEASAGAQARKVAATAAAARSEAEPADPLAVPVDLSAEARLACGRERHRFGPRTELDLALARGLPTTRIRRDRLEALIALLLRHAGEGIEDGWGCVSVITGTTDVARSHLSDVYPFPARPRELASGPFLFLEVHDTGPPLSRAGLDALREGRKPADPRGRSPFTAMEAAGRLGATLHVAGAPGCGSQSLLLLPIR